MRVGRLRRIKKHILEEPLRVNMVPLVVSRNPEVPIREIEERKLPKGHVPRWPACNTVGCIAGWEILLYGDIATDGAPEAARRLALRNQDLFFVHSWPRDLALRIGRERGGSKAYAAIVAEAIESYIATDGWQKEVQHVG